MKYCPIKKNKNKRKPFIVETRIPLKKPKIPKKIIWNVNKPNNFYI